MRNWFGGNCALGAWLSKPPPPSKKVDPAELAGTQGEANSVTTPLQLVDALVARHSLQRQGGGGLYHLGPARINSDASPRALDVLVPSAGGSSIWFLQMTRILWGFGPGGHLPRRCPYCQRRLLGVVVQHNHGGAVPEQPQRRQQRCFFFGGGRLPGSKAWMHHIPQGCYFP